MEASFNKSQDVITKDGQILGQPKHLFHRTSEINPALEWYADYLYVFSFEHGDDYYVPTDFVTQINENIHLSVTLQEVMNKTWTRLPNFIVFGECQKEDLPPA